MVNNQGSSEDEDHSRLSVDNSIGSASTVDLGEYGGEYGTDDEEDEIKALLRLGGGYFVASASWTLMKLTDTALVGHVGTKYLDGVAYSDLYTSATGVLVQGQVLMCFCGQAYGAGNMKLVGTWLKVSLVVLLVMAIPVAGAWALTGPALAGFGVQRQSRRIASKYAGVLATCLPARIGFQQLAQYFVAQKMTRPPALAAVVGLFFNVVGGLVFVFGIPGIVPGFGFLACPAVTASVEYVQCIGLSSRAFFFYDGNGIFQKNFFFSRRRRENDDDDNSEDFVSGGSSQRRRPLLEEDAEDDEEAWWRDLTRSRIRKYLSTYIPAALASASDYWRLTVVGFIAATLSEDDLGVFNASYRIMWLSLAVAGSLGAAVGARLGVRLGERDPRRAKHGIRVGLGFTVVTLLVLAVTVAAIPRQLGSIFTRDPKLLRRFVKGRYALAAVVFLMNLAVVLEKVPVACGHTKKIFFVGFLASWLGQVPAVFILVKCWRRNLIAVYLGVATGYALTCVGLLLVIATTDFNAVCNQAALRSEVLLGGHNNDDDSDEDMSSDWKNFFNIPAFFSSRSRGGGEHPKKPWWRPGPHTERSNYNPIRMTTVPGYRRTRDDSDDLSSVSSSTVTSLPS